MAADGQDLEQLNERVLEGEALVSAGRSDEAIAVLDEIAVTFGAIDDPEVQERVAYALNLKAGLMLLAGDETGEALVVLRALVDRLQDASDESRALRATAMVNLGQGLALAERFEEAAEVFRELVAEYAEDPDAESRSRVALALGNLETLAEALGLPDEARAARARLLRDYGEDALVALDAAATQGAQSLEPQRRMQRAGALYKKAVLLRDLQRPEEAVAVVDVIQAEYEGDEHPAIGEVLAAALELREELG
jgi:tetratricopeptide (TPR) repeat protein